MDDILFKDESFRIIGACMEVHRQLGPGFLESVYQEALCIEFGFRVIPFLEQYEARIFYKDQLMTKKFKPDFLCFDNILVEIKANSILTAIDQAQIINALKATKFELGLLVNFGEISLIHQRFANTGTAKMNR